MANKAYAVSAALLVMLATAAPLGAAEPLYKIDRGPLDVQTLEQQVFVDKAQDRSVPLRIIYPDGDGPYPLVVFSTGAFCFPQMYDLVTTHWASHGYVVIVPNHLDSPNNEAPPTPAQYPLMFPSRVRDVSFVVDDIDAISRSAGIEGRVDSTRLAAAGHSFGAIVAMVKIGLELQDEFEEAWISTYDDRFEAAVLLSAPGPGPLLEALTDDAYSGIRKPLIATGGTNDVGRVDPGEYSAAEWRTLAFKLAPPGDKYSVITEGSDHYMGGLICNPDRGGDPDHESVAIVAAVTTAFLDAYIKDDKAAREFINTADIDALTGGQARAKRR